MNVQEQDLVLHCEALDPEDRVRDYVERLPSQKAALDRMYAERRSLVMDLRILTWTAPAVVLRRDVAVNPKTARLTLRRRPKALRPEDFVSPVGMFPCVDAGGARTDSRHEYIRLEGLRHALTVRRRRSARTRGVRRTSRASCRSMTAVANHPTEVTAAA